MADPTKDPTEELPGLDALDGIDSALPDPEPEPEPVPDGGDQGGEDQPAGDEEVDEVFEALAAKDPAKAEKYVEYLEKERAAAEALKNPPAEIIAVEPDDLGLDSAVEQEMNAQAYKAEQVKLTDQFQQNTLNQLFTRGQKLIGRYQRAVEKYGKESEEAIDIEEDYQEIKLAHIRAKELHEGGKAWVRTLEGIDDLIKAAPVLRQHRAAITRLADNRILDPFATAAEIKAVLREHLPKIAPKTAAAKAAKPAPDKIKLLRERLGSSRGSGGANTQSVDGEPAVERARRSAAAKGKSGQFEQYYAKIRGERKTA